MTRQLRICFISSSICIGLMTPCIRAEENSKLHEIAGWIIVGSVIGGVIVYKVRTYFWGDPYEAQRSATAESVQKVDADLTGFKQETAGNFNTVLQGQETLAHGQKSWL